MEIYFPGQALFMNMLIQVLIYQQKASQPLIKLEVCAFVLSLWLSFHNLFEGTSYLPLLLGMMALGTH